jgi:hypothetical protein
MFPRRIAALGAIGFALAFAASTASVARTIYDGTWSVQVSGRTQGCMGSMRYRLYIQNGRIGYAGGDATVSGRVSGKGTVSVRIATSGGQSGFATGRLTPRSGSGIFRGHSSSGLCAGTWVGDRMQ